jgi:hypothetical protein
METLNAIQTIQDDFEAQQPPFDNIQFPEQRLLEELDTFVWFGGMEDRLRALTLFATFDYNRNAGRLVDNIVELLDTRPRYEDHCRRHLNPSEVPVFEHVAILQDTLSDIGFRYPNMDGRAWQKNCEILRENYHGMVSELLLSTQTDAEALVEQLRADEFLYLKGDKIAPMYARIVSENVCELSNLWALDIPVDTHIRRLSKDLFNFNDTATDDMIRSKWRYFATEYDIERQIVDGALWQIGNNWDEWGEEYWSGVVNT